MKGFKFIKLFLICFLALSLNLIAQDQNNTTSQGEEVSQQDRVDTSDVSANTQAKNDLERIDRLERARKAADYLSKIANVMERLIQGTDLTDVISDLNSGTVVGDEIIDDINLNLLIAAENDQLEKSSASGTGVYVDTSVSPVNNSVPATPLNQNIGQQCALQYRTINATTNEAEWVEANNSCRPGLECVPQERSLTDVTPLCQYLETCRVVAGVTDKSEKTRCLENNGCSVTSPTPVCASACNSVPDMCYYQRECKVVPQTTRATGPNNANVDTSNADYDSNQDAALLAKMSCSSNSECESRNCFQTPNGDGTTTGYCAPMSLCESKCIQEGEALQGGFNCCTGLEPRNGVCSLIMYSGVQFEPIRWEVTGNTCKPAIYEESDTQGSLEDRTRRLRNKIREYEDAILAFEYLATTSNSDENAFRINRSVKDIFNNVKTTRRGVREKFAQEQEKLEEAQIKITEGRLIEVNGQEQEVNLDGLTQSQISMQKAITASSGNIALKKMADLSMALSIRSTGLQAVYQGAFSSLDAYITNTLPAPTYKYHYYKREKRKRKKWYKGWRRNKNMCGKKGKKNLTCTEKCVADSTENNSYTIVDPLYNKNNINLGSSITPNNIANLRASFLNHYRTYGSEVVHNATSQENLSRRDFILNPLTVSNDRLTELGFNAEQIAEMPDEVKQIIAEQILSYKIIDMFKLYGRNSGGSCSYSNKTRNKGVSLTYLRDVSSYLEEYHKKNSEMRAQLSQCLTDFLATRNQLLTQNGDNRTSQGDGTALSFRTTVVTDVAGTNIEAADVQAGVSCGENGGTCSNLTKVNANTGAGGVNNSAGVNDNSVQSDNGQASGSSTSGSINSNNNSQSSSRSTPALAAARDRINKDNAKFLKTNKNSKSFNNALKSLGAKQDAIRKIGSGGGNFASNSNGSNVGKGQIASNGNAAKIAQDKKNAQAQGLSYEEYLKKLGVGKYVKPYNNRQSAYGSSNNNSNDQSNSNIGGQNLTGLSDGERQYVLDNLRDRKRDFLSTEKDGLFEKVSKTYKRYAYPIFLRRKLD